MPTENDPRKAAPRRRRSSSDTIPLVMNRGAAAPPHAGTPSEAHFAATIPVTLARPPRQSVKVFLIEDSPFVRERVAEKITANGRVEVVGYADTEGSAIERLQNIRCDAIVLDLALRQGTGFQVLRSLRTAASKPYVVIFTDYVHTHFREQTLELGADQFLDKSKDFDHLREILEALAAPGTPETH